MVCPRSRRPALGRRHQILGSLAETEARRLSREAIRSDGKRVVGYLGQHPAAQAAVQTSDQGVTVSRAQAGTIVLVDWRRRRPLEPTKIRPSAIIEDQELFPGAHPDLTGAVRQATGA